MRLEQQMKLAPRIIQAMEILQLPMLALTDRIDAELEANPVLELRLGDGGEAEPAPADDYPAERGEQPLVVREDDSFSEDFERLANYEAEYGPDSIWADLPARPRPAPTGERDRKLDAMANTPAREQSLNEYLHEQWTFVEADAEVKAAGGRIIDQIDEDGYLRTALEALAGPQGQAPTAEHLRQALALVQTLDPLGVGARDLAECLTLQLSAEAASGRDVGLELELVANHLRDIEMNRLPRIARRAGRTIEEVKAGIETISHLNPRPGLLVGQHAAPVILPDATVDVGRSGETVVTMSAANTPRLHISRDYRRLARDRGVDRAARQFLQKNIRSAHWLIGAIEQRRETVRRVVEAVFRVQGEFLERGAAALKPLPMAEVAREVGVHVATVSRAVAGKYVQTPRGIYPLRMFFSGGTTTEGGDDVAWDAVKAKLKEIVDGEDKSKPLNDDKLAAALRACGIEIARRTVAKYRSLMGIPPARKRKEY